MKKPLFSLFAILALFLFTNASYYSTPEPLPQADLNQQDQQEYLWQTPTGLLIPYSERENWSEYVQSQLELPDFIDLSGHPRPIVKKYYSAITCVIAGSRCSFRCARTTTAGSCIRKTDCAPCINCC